MAKKEWCDWLKCNVLEIIILILVIVLLVKVFSAPAVEEVSQIPAAIKEPAPIVEETPTETLPSPEALPEVTTEETPPQTE